VNRRLTLNLGVRWNPFVPVFETAYNQEAIFSSAAYSQGGFVAKFWEEAILASTSWLSVNVG